ncbi:MAG: hypothetical protein ABW212_04985 [Pseudonocardia sediminis]
MSTPATTPLRTPAPSRSQRRSAVGDRLLDSLEALVARHRALAPHSPEDRGLHAELITAEVAQELAMARRALARTPHLTVVEQPEDDR